MTFTHPDGTPIDYRHSNTWFAQHHKNNWEKVISPLASSISKYLEIGVCEGSSMLWVLTNLKPDKAYGVDPWAPRSTRRRSVEKFKQQANEAYNNAHHNLKWWIDRGIVSLLRTTSFDALVNPSFKDGEFDLIYVDGDHEALPALTDMVLAWRKLAMGGIMVLDDYNRRWLHGKPKSKEAIDAFLMACESRYKFLYRGDRQQIIQRTK